MVAAVEMVAASLAPAVAAVGMVAASLAPAVALGAPQAARVADSGEWVAAAAR
jgi:hypothetical protein